MESSNSNNNIINESDQLQGTPRSDISRENEAFEENEEQENNSRIFGDEEDEQIEYSNENPEEGDNEEYVDNEEGGMEEREGQEPFDSEFSDNGYTDEMHSEHIKTIQDQYDEPEYDNSALPPERKIRFKLFRFINKLRSNYRLSDFFLDDIGNRTAMAYADYLLKEKENDTQLDSIANANFQFGHLKTSTFSIFTDSNDAGKKASYSDYLNDFIEAHSTLVEFESHRLNMLSSNLNCVSIGIAYDEEKVVVVDLFTYKDLFVDGVNINQDMGTLIVKGVMQNEKFGVYVMRIVAESNPTRSLAMINPQQIVSPDQKNRPFTGSFSGVGAILEDPSPKFIEIYIREKPNTIRYNLPFTGVIKLEDLNLAYRIPLASYPNERIIYEQKKEEDEEISRLNKEFEKRVLMKTKEKNERDARRNKIKNDFNGQDFYKIDELSENDEIDDEDRKIDLPERPNIKIDTRGNKDDSNSRISDPSDVSNADSNISEHFGKNERNFKIELDRLEFNVEELRKENEDYQRKIRVIFDWRKKELREDKSNFKDSNINDSTYMDSLNSASQIYDQLNTQKKILKSDLEKYNQTVEIQQQRKQQIYRILMNYKEDLLANAEKKNGTKIPDYEKERWLDEEKRLEDEIRQLRIENIKHSFELNRKNKSLKKLEEYFEGLHIIDFEQLKIENNTLTEKIEDRNEDIHKFRSKITSNVQVLAHLQEKFVDVNNQHKQKSDGDNHLLDKLKLKKKDLNSLKITNEKGTIKKLKMKQKIDQINSEDLNKYFSKTNSSIEELNRSINAAIENLSRMRQGGNQSDILLLKNRKESLMRDYKITLDPNRKDDTKLNIA